jgi:hypothetical protein
MRNERRPSGSGMGAAETSAGNRATAPRPHFHLYETLTRHLQRWSSPTNRAYERERVEIRVLLMVDPDQAVARQDEEILRHTPRDNARVPF